MHLIRVGNLTISLEHLILVEDAQGEPEPRTLPPGLYRMTLETGRVLELTGERAEVARELVDEVAIRRGGKVRPAQMGYPLDPPASAGATGTQPLDERKESRG